MPGQTWQSHYFLLFIYNSGDYPKWREMLRCAQHDRGVNCHAERSEASLAPCDCETILVFLYGSSQFNSLPLRQNHHL